jgi:transcriptional regulator with XRE-family HTH domain
VPLNTLSKNLKKYRQQSDWTQEYIAKALDISIGAYSKLETGHTNINLSRVEQIALFYKISVVELLTDEKNEANELSRMKHVIIEKDAEIMELQRVIIDLHQKLKD